MADHWPRVQQMSQDKRDTDQNISPRIGGNRKRTIETKYKPTCRTQVKGQGRNRKWQPKKEPRNQEDKKKGKREAKPTASKPGDRRLMAD